MHYNLPPWSISILPDCKNTVYNTARVRNSLYLFILQLFLQEDTYTKFQDGELCELNILLALN